MSICFDLDHICAISIDHNYDKTPDISRVAPVARRRLGDCARLSYGVSAGLDIDVPVVFSSYYAEINRCFDLLSNLKNEVSPASFSLSVLNAVAAMLSIEHKNTSEILAISARASVEYAILNALKFQKAYVISYFEGVKKEYYSHEPFNIAIGMMVSRGSKYELNFSKSDKISGISEVCFLENFDNLSEWSYSDGELEWKWQKRA